MIERYTLPEMGEIWSENSKFQTWLDVELAACQANFELGKITKEDLDQIKTKSKFNVERIKEIEKEVKHDVIAFLTNLNEYVGNSGRFIHVGMTSSDILDTGLSLQLRESCNLLINEIEALENTIRNLASQHKNTLMIGRSHAIHGEPISFGFKLAGWLAEVIRDKKRLKDLKSNISIGQISGAMGTYANTDPKVEEIACNILNLKVDEASTQVISRDRHAEYVQVIALIGASLDRFATEIRNLQRTDVLEVEEGFSEGQKGSSAMPHKRNPIRSERVSGLSRILRSYVNTALENISLWHERDISHSSVERVIFPDTLILLDFSLNRMSNVVKNLIVNEKKMLDNLNNSKGLYNSQRVLLKLIEKGLTREDAYKKVQKIAMDSWNKNKNFKDLLKKNKSIKGFLSSKEIDKIFELEYHFKNINHIYKQIEK